MENVIDMTNADLPFLKETQTDETAASDAKEQDLNTEETPARDRPKAPTRGKARTVMFITALCGTAAGVILALSGKADAQAVMGVSERITGTFGEIFLHRAISGGAVLLLEFIFGFFAFGDYISWIFPMLGGMGAGFFAAALQKPVFLPSEIAVLLVVIFAAANSAVFSQKLLGLASGERAYMRGMTLSEYCARFAVMLPIIIAAAIYEGIAATSFTV